MFTVRDFGRSRGGWEENKAVQGRNKVRRLAVNVSKSVARGSRCQVLDAVTDPEMAAAGQS